jgi:hypothetical protein
MERWGRYPARAMVFLVVLALVYFIMEHINGRFWLHDFRVYYGAGEALLTGRPVYGVAHGLDSGTFKYAPFLAVLYSPLATLPYSVAATLQYALIVLAFVDVLRRMDRLLRDHILVGYRPDYRPLLLTALTCGVQVHRELHLGNINLLVLWLLIVALENVLRGRITMGGLLVGMAVLAKPHFIVLLPLFVLRGRTMLLCIALVALFAGLLAPALFLGFSPNMALHWEWLRVMAGHNDGLVYLGGDNYRSVNTIYSFLYRAGARGAGFSPGPFTALVLGHIAVLFAYLVWRHQRAEKRHQLRSAFPFEYLLLISLVPSITLTDTEHFLFTAPLVMFILYHLVPAATPRWLPYLAVPFLLLFGGNWVDLLGPVADFLIHHGALGIGNSGLILIAMMLFTRSNHSPLRTSDAV